MWGRWGSCRSDESFWQFEKEGLFLSQMTPKAMPLTVVIEAIYRSAMADVTLVEAPNPFLVEMRGAAWLLAEFNPTTENRISCNSAVGEKRSF